MRIMYGCCAGLDVHKETVQCCVRRVEPDGSLQETVRQFGTMTDDLLEMVEALKAQGVTHVAMESTGVFWKPIYNLLEEHFSIVLVNPAHCQQVPGRKTDVKRLSVAGGVTAVRAVARQLYSAAVAARPARPDSRADAVDQRTDARGQPDA